ncbi:MAG: hypothetical protein ACRC46_03500 [Thermoguttaceae bacterium]
MNEKPEKQIRDEVENVLKLAPQFLYKGELCKPVNNQQYSETAAKIITERKNMELLNHIAVVTRVGSYKRRNHDGKPTTQNKDSNREEDRTAMKLFQQNFPHIGMIEDYQTPLKSSNADTGLGKVDMFSYNSVKNTAYLLELKLEDNKETLLRAVLEVYTYWRTINIQKLLFDFELPSDTLVKKAVLLFDGCTAYNQYSDKEKNKNTIALMEKEKLGVEFFGIRKHGNNYEVFK